MEFRIPRKFFRMGMRSIDTQAMPLHALSWNFFAKHCCTAFRESFLSRKFLVIRYAATKQYPQQTRGGGVNTYSVD